MSTKNKCQPNTNVNQKQMSIKIKWQPKTKVNKNTQLNPTEPNITQPNSTQPKGCHIEVTQPCINYV